MFVELFYIFNFLYFDLEDPPCNLHTNLFNPHPDLNSTASISALLKNIPGYSPWTFLLISGVMIMIVTKQIRNPRNSRKE